MAKRALRSIQSSSNSPQSPATTKSVLRTKSTDGTKRSTRSTRHSIFTRNKEKTPNKSVIELKKKPKSKIKKADAKMPKKPPTAFFYFLEDFRKDFQEENPDVKSMRDVGKACGEKWKTMTYEEKVKYYDIATEKRAEFDRATADYIKRKENGEDEESEDDSDFDM